MELLVVGKNSSQTYTIVQGNVADESYNEDLDSGTVILAQLTSKIDIEPYDVVEIIEGSDVLYTFLVDNYQCKETNLNPKLYFYTISLMSMTKELEGIVLPSLKITKNYSDTKSVYYYLNQYLEEYGTKYYHDNYYGANIPKYHFATRVQTRFNSIECPEMQWNEPTLREVLNDLMMVDDCIVILKGTEIDFIDVSEVKGNVGSQQKDYVNYITESQSASDYVSDIKMHLVNAANNSKPTGAYSEITDDTLPIDKTSIVEEIGFRNSDSYILSDENIRLETSFPIWQLYYVEISATFTSNLYIQATTSGGTTALVNLPASANRQITLKLKDSSVNYILEKGEWETKPVYYGAIGQGGQPLSTDYQNTCLYYTRGQKNIENFNAKQTINNLFIESQFSVYELIKGKMDVWGQEVINRFQEYYGDQYESYANVDPTFWVYTTDEGKWTNFTFKVAYETLDDCVFTASKTPFTTNKRTIIDNQTNSYINPQRQGALEYFKANRLGNKVKVLNARYPISDFDSNKIELGYKYDKSIVFKREFAYYDNYVSANYYATENYVLQDYFTGVKSKLRSWKLLSGSDALIRADLFKFYVNSTLQSVSSTRYKLPVYENMSEYLENFNYCTIKFEIEHPQPTPKYIPDPNSPIAINDGSGTINAVSDMFAVEFSKHRCGKSALFTIKMPDNAIVGKYISAITSITTTIGGSSQQNAYYVDGNGEFIGGVIRFYKTSTGQEKYNHYKSLMKPYVYTAEDYTDLQCEIPFTLHKDNGEITQITIQFEWNEDADNIFVGKL